jgi:hypothetical protein
MVRGSKYLRRKVVVRPEIIAELDDTTTDGILMVIAAAWTAVLYHMKGSALVGYQVFQMFSDPAGSQKQSNISIKVVKSLSTKDARDDIATQLGHGRTIGENDSPNNESIICLGPLDSFEADQVNDNEHEVKAVLHFRYLCNADRVRLRLSCSSTQKYLARLNCCSWRRSIVLPLPTYTLPPSRRPSLSCPTGWLMIFELCVRLPQKM